MGEAIAAVCFDLDGTLVDSEGEAADAFELAMEPLGRRLSAKERDFVVGHGFGEIYAFIKAGGGLPWSSKELEEAVFAARVTLFARNGAGELPGAKEVVRKLSSRWPCALVTGSTRSEANLMLEALGITDCFAVTLCAGEYPQGKPSPIPYQQAAQALGVSPQQCVAIEDSTAGIQSARSAGMHCIGVRVGNRYGQDQSHAHQLVDTLLDVESLLLSRERI
ncbi:MAG: HAD family phosphatase [Polyangia bacterium]